MRHSNWGAVRGLLAVGLLMLVGVWGCSKPGWLKTYPVKGVVLVDGKPAKDVMIAFHPREKQEDRPHLPSGRTDEKGEFQLSTFVTDDGAPEGLYEVTIIWPERYNPISTLWEGDKLKGRYATKEKTEFRGIKIEAKPQELPPFEVSTTGKKGAS